MKPPHKWYFRRRRGTVVWRFISVMILIMIFLAFARAAINLLPAPVPSIASQLDPSRNDCSQATPENSGGNQTQVSAEVRAELADPSFLALTTGYAKDAALQLPQETFFGFMNKSQEMRDWGPSLGLNHGLQLRDTGLRDV